MKEKEEGSARLHTSSNSLFFPPLLSLFFLKRQALPLYHFLQNISLFVFQFFSSALLYLVSLLKFTKQLVTVFRSPPRLFSRPTNFIRECFRQPATLNGCKFLDTQTLPIYHTVLFGVSENYCCNRLCYFERRFHRRSEAPCSFIQLWGALS